MRSFGPVESFVRFQLTGRYVEQLRFARYSMNLSWFSPGSSTSQSNMSVSPFAVTAWSGRSPV